MNQVFILRGPSGAGKSHWVANHLKKPHVVCSTDEFFMVDGEYQFDVSRLSEAHQWCLGQFIDALQNEVETIVLDNTNIKKWQYANYAVLADYFGYEVVLVDFLPETIDELRLIVDRNVHGVPRSKVCEMIADFEIDSFYEIIKVKVS